MTWAMIYCAVAILGSGTVGQALHGTITDANGKAIVGARVDVANAAPRSGPAIFCESCYSDCTKHTLTNSDGRFEFNELDPTLKFRVLASAPGFTSRLTE